ncbi:MAG: tRNA-dihydrouridine synthase family protein [Candidatus Yanofskybacteria bacterium]|nr:tRNA-dihydrouridine synthase family protein [Candidatus Yanofskybacteria bacterium]
MSNFWQKLERPFFILAPMANVTDWAFRKIVAKCGRPDVFYTEFLSCDGILHDKTKFEKELYFEKSEKPIVVQFFGSKPENFYKCAQLAAELGFDGIDINMGCPDRSVEKQGAGAALIKNPKLAKEIIKETKRGARSTSSGQALPVSIKTRLGYNKIETREWVSTLLETEPAVLIIHGRTRKEMSSVPAHWDEIGTAAEVALALPASLNSLIPSSQGTKTLIIGNGDVASLEDAKKKAKDYKLDGIMVGRGIFANPWFFNEKVDIKEIKPKQRIELLRGHLDNFEKLWGSNGRFDTMKKFFKVYISNWDGAKELRAKLMMAKNKQGVVDILQNQL